MEKNQRLQVSTVFHTFSLNDMAPEQTVHGIQIHEVALYKLIHKSLVTRNPDL